MKLFEKSLRRLGASGRNSNYLSSPVIQTQERRAEAFQRSAEAAGPASASGSVFFDGADEAERLSERFERESRRYPTGL